MNVDQVRHLGEIRARTDAVLAWIHGDGSTDPPEPQWMDFWDNAPESAAWLLALVVTLSSLTTRPAVKGTLMPADFTPDPAAVECAARAALAHEWMSGTFACKCGYQLCPEDGDYDDVARQAFRQHRVEAIIVALVTEGHLVPKEDHVTAVTWYREGRDIERAAFAEAIALLRRIAAECQKNWKQGQTPIDNGMLSAVASYVAAHPEAPDA